MDGNPGQELSALLESPENAAHLSAPQWESVIHTLRGERLLGCLCCLAKASNVLESYPAYAQRHLISIATLADQQAKQIRYECRLLQEALQNISVTPVFLKGAAYTLRNTANSKGRLCGDIDLLVRGDEIAASEAALQACGYQSAPSSEYDDRYYREWAHEVPPLFNSERDTVIDLHHNILPPISGRALSAATLVEQRAVLDDGFTTLSAEAMALHSMVHLLVNDDLSSAYRDLVDLWLILGEFGNETFWDALYALALETGYLTELWYTLRLIQHHFKAFSMPGQLMHVLDEHCGGMHHRLVLTYILIPAIMPSHAAALPLSSRAARFLAYARGHWMKMPLPILIKHTFTKSWLSLRDKLFGKYQFDAEDA